MNKAKSVTNAKSAKNSKSGSFEIIPVIAVSAVIVVMLITAIIDASQTTTITDLIKNDGSLPKVTTTEPTTAEKTELQLMSLKALGGTDVYAFSKFYAQNGETITSNNDMFTMITEHKTVDSYKAETLVTEWLNDTTSLLYLLNTVETELGVQTMMSCNKDVYTAIIKYNQLREDKYIPVCLIYQIQPIDETNYIEISCSNESLEEYDRDTNRAELAEIAAALNLNYTEKELGVILGVESDGLLDVDNYSDTGYTPDNFFEFDTKSGTILKYRQNEEDVPATVVIPPTIQGATVRAIGEKAFYMSNSTNLITSVTIPDSVTEIKDNAFMANTKLYYVSMPQNLTNLGEGAFQSCSSLKEIEIKGSLYSIKENTFKDCDSLETVTFCGTEELIEMSAFENCRLLTNVYNTASVTAIDKRAFKGTRVKREDFANASTERNSFDD